MLASGLLTGTVTKTWHIPGPHACAVQLKHNTYTGYRYVLVNAIEQRGTEVC